MLVIVHFVFRPASCYSLFFIRPPPHRTQPDPQPPSPTRRSSDPRGSQHKQTDSLRAKIVYVPVHKPFLLRDSQTAPMSSLSSLLSVAVAVLSLVIMWSIFFDSSGVHQRTKNLHRWRGYRSQTTFYGYLYAKISNFKISSNLISMLIANIL